MTGSDDRRQDPPVNNGLMISGGTHYVGNHAGGHGAQAFSGSVSFPPPDAGRTADLLATSERLMEEPRAPVTDPDATSRELRRLREDLDEADPQPTVLRRALDRLNEF